MSVDAKKALRVDLRVLLGDHAFEHDWSSRQLHPRLTPLFFAHIQAFLDLGDLARLHRVCHAFRWRPDGEGPVSFLRIQRAIGSFNVMKALGYLNRKAIDVANLKDPLVVSLALGMQEWRHLNLVGTQLPPLFFGQNCWPKVVRLEVNAREVIDGRVAIEQFPRLQALHLHMGEGDSLLPLTGRIWRHLPQLELREFRGSVDCGVNLAALRAVAPCLQRLKMHLVANAADPLSVGVSLIQLALHQFPLTVLRIEPNCDKLAIVPPVGIHALTAGCNHLTEFYVAECLVSDQSVRLMATGFPQLEKLHLVHCAGPTPIAFDYLVSTKSLRHLTFDVYNISVTADSSALFERGIGRLKQVTHLVIDSRLAGHGLTNLRQLHYLGLACFEVPNWDRLLQFIESRPLNERMLIQVGAESDKLLQMADYLGANYPNRRLRLIGPGTLPIYWSTDIAKLFATPSTPTAGQSLSRTRN